LDFLETLREIEKAYQVILQEGQQQQDQYFKVLSEWELGRQELLDVWIHSYAQFRITYKPKIHVFG